MTKGFRLRNRQTVLIASMSAILIMFLAAGCDIFDFSPFETDLKNEDKNLNEKSLTVLSAAKTAQADSFTFAFITDSHGDYDDFLDAVCLINGRDDILFVIHGGDITDFGLKDEYETASSIIRQSNKPFFTLAGNHDCLSEGRELYSSMFGDSFFSFKYPPDADDSNAILFICLNDNTLEHDLNSENAENVFNWIEKSFASTGRYKGTIVAAHVPPFNDHYFDNELEGYYRSLMYDNNVLISLHGHEHEYYYGEYYEDGVPYLLGEDIGDRNFCTLTVHFGETVNFTISRVYY